MRQETPEERGLTAKRARLAQRELDLPMLRAQLNASEARYLQLTVSRIAEVPATSRRPHTLCLELCPCVSTRGARARVG